MNTKLILSNHEVETVVSALLFTSSVNVVANNTDPLFQQSLIETAKRLKQECPDLKLKNVQFIKEDNYEDQYTVDIYENFKDTLEVTTFKGI